MSRSLLDLCAVGNPRRGESMSAMLPSTIEASRVCSGPALNGRLQRRFDVTTYRLTLGSEVKFEAQTAGELAQHLVVAFPPAGAFPSPNALNSGFAIVLPDDKRLQGLQAMRWIAQHR